MIRHATLWYLFYKFKQYMLFNLMLISQIVFWKKSWITRGEAHKLTLDRYVWQKDILLIITSISLNDVHEFIQVMTPKESAVAKSTGFQNEYGASEQDSALFRVLFSKERFQRTMPTTWIVLETVLTKMNLNVQNVSLIWEMKRNALW